MQNFWWNRKFYHGKEEPDSFRLHRLEEGQTAATAAVASLSKAQTALEQLMTAHESLLSEHTSLLSDLTAIAEGLQEELQAVSVECDNIGSELVMLENNDAALSARVDGMEEACADTAAEQTTRIDALEKQAEEEAVRVDAIEGEVSATTAVLDEERSKIAALQEEQGTTNAKVTALQTDYGVGAVLFTGDGAGAVLSGQYPVSVMTLYDSEGNATNMMLTGSEERSLTLPSSGVLYGVADLLEVKEGAFSRLDLRGMTCLKTLRLRYGNFTLNISSLPHLSEVLMEGVSGRVDLRNQTDLGALTLISSSATLYLPTRPKSLCFVHLSADHVTEELLDDLLPDRTGDNPGNIFLDGVTAPDFVAQRNWMVM